MAKSGLAIPTKHTGVLELEEQQLVWKNLKAKLAVGPDGKLHYTNGNDLNDVRTTYNHFGMNQEKTYNSFLPGHFTCFEHYHAAWRPGNG